MSAFLKRHVRLVYNVGQLFAVVAELKTSIEQLDSQDPTAMNAVMNKARESETLLSNVYLDLALVRGVKPE